MVKRNAVDHPLPSEKPRAKSLGSLAGLRAYYLSLQANMREAGDEADALFRMLEADPENEKLKAQHEQFVAVMVDSRRKILLLEQKPGFRLKRTDDIEPLLGEWGVHEGIMRDRDGHLRTTLVFPTAEKVDTLFKYRGVSHLKLAGDYDLRDILPHEGMKGVEVLELRHTHLGAMGVLCLAKSPHLDNLRTLDLVGTGLGYQGLEDLLSSSNYPNLDTLVLDGSILRLIGENANEEDLEMLWKEGEAEDWEEDDSMDATEAQGMALLNQMAKKTGRTNLEFSFE